MTPPGFSGSRALAALALAGLCLMPSAAHAFIYPEHRDITVAATSKLAPADQAALASLWGTARPAFIGPLCQHDARTGALTCLDFSDLPALAGDHSCSVRDLEQNVLPSNWVLRVADVAAKTREILARKKTPNGIYNELATMHLTLQGVDPDYLSRAGGNNAHFLLARSSDLLDHYVEQSVRTGAPLNALGLYLQYHVAALRLARALALGTAQPRAVAARDVLVLEAFAAHWLEDMFAAGHAAGTWGDTAWRKGTHDYYNEHGLDTTTWGGERMIAYGDANLKPADRERASIALAISLTQVLGALQPGNELAASVDEFGPGATAMIDFDTCRTEKQPLGSGIGVLTTRDAFLDLLRKLPTPGRGDKDVHFARFRQEFGVFAGAYGGATGALNGGGVGAQGFRPSFELDAGLRVGYAAPAITGTTGTSNVFFESGIVVQSAQSNHCDTAECGDNAAVVGILPRVPARTGLQLGLRLPFYVLPGDLLVLAPLLVGVAPKTLSRIGIAAIQGGLVPYERSFRTPAGVLQIIAGREADVTLFGVLAQAIEVRPLTAAEDAGGLIATRSIRARFPLLEWTPLRSFATNVTFAVPLQLGVGFEAPLSSRVLLPAGAVAESPGLSWTAFLRIQLDAQYFPGAREDLQ